MTTPEEREIDRLNAEIARLRADKDALLATGKEIDRFILVIESAMRADSPQHHAAVLAALKANRAAIKAEEEGK